MFGGFSSEVILNELAMVLYDNYEDHGSAPAAAQVSAFDTMSNNIVNVVEKSSITPNLSMGFRNYSLVAVLVGYIYFADSNNQELGKGNTRSYQNQYL